MSHLICHIATKAGGEDLLFMIAQRMQERRVRLVVLLRSLGAALIDRGYWLRDQLSGSLIGVFALTVVTRCETFLFYSGVGVGIVSAAMTALRMIVHSLKPSYALFGASLAVVLGAAVFLRFFAGITRRLMEIDVDGLEGPRFLVTYTLAAAGTISAWMLIGNSVVIFCTWVLCMMFMILTANMEEQKEQRRRERQQGSWRPAVSRRQIANEEPEARNDKTEADRRERGSQVGEEGALVRELISHATAFVSASRA